jgi:DNA-binding CsgD family transcriptional regulator
MRQFSAIDEYAAEIETVLAMATRLERVDAKANTLSNAAHAFTVLGRPHLASAYFDEAIAFALLHRHAGTLTLLHSWKALHLFFIGQLAAARESLLAAQRGTTDQLLVRVNVAAWGTLVGQFLDDRALAERCFDEGLLTGRAAWAVYLAPGYTAYMEDRGRHSEAQALLHACLGGRDYEPGLVLTLLAVARLGSLDDVPVARRLLLCGVERHHPVCEAALPHFDALVERRSGHRSRAETSAGKAVEGYQRLGYPLLEAEAHELAGCPDLAEALYRKSGAVGPLGRLAKLAPAPPRPRTRASREASRHALTPREREVAALVTRGLSNVEIAERLALSAKGVEKHLSAIHRKTGVPSRARLVAYLLGASSGDVLT